jgi:hypothetical protein
MLVLRGLVLSRRWKEEFAKITESMARDRRLNWECQSPDMPAQLKAGTDSTPRPSRKHNQLQGVTPQLHEPFEE